MLALLANEPMHGYQMMQEIDERSGGAWQPSPGSIYPTLPQMTDEGLVVAAAVEGKNVFHLTDAGRAAVDQVEGPPAWERLAVDAQGDVVGLKRSLFQLGAAVKQVSAAGTERQVSEARRIVNDARKAVYELLAEDD